MTQKQTLIMQKAVLKKLLSAIAMLLVSFLMLGSTTYAWLVIGVSPEIKDIKTTIGGNGYLEIALQSGTNTIT